MRPSRRGSAALVSLLLLGGLLAAQAHGAHAASAPRSFAAGEVLVHYRGSPGDTEVEVREGESVAGALARLRSDPAVGYAHPNYLVRAARFWPNDPGSAGRARRWYRDQWNFLPPTRVPGGIGMPGGWQRAIWDHAPGGRGVTVAVLDSGVAYRKEGHRYRRGPDLPPKKRFVHPRDFVDGDRLPLDLDGHGTHVAGTIAQATDNGLGLTGIAYGVRVMPIRVLNRKDIGTASDVAKGIRFASGHGADVINLSIEFQPVVRRCRQIKSVCDAIRGATDRGVTVVASAGNHRKSRVAYPAAAHGAIAVGATTYRGCAADYSNYGSGLDMMAPGGGMDKSKALAQDPLCRPNAPGYEVRQYSLLPDAARHRNFRKFGIVGHRGTSMAAAHVSGVAALLIADGQCGPHPTPSTVAQRLEDTTIDRGLVGRDDIYGHGLLDAARALNPAEPCRS
jgi:serine protease